MTEPFCNKYTDRGLLVLSLVSVVVYSFFTDGQLLSLWGNWLAAGVLAWLVRDIFSRNHLGLVERNHTHAISWAIISMTLNFVFVNFKSSVYSQADLLFIAGFVGIIILGMLAWQQKIAPFNFILMGLIVGILSAIHPSAILCLLFFPAIFLQMRVWSWRNLGSLVSGFLFAIWVTYCLFLFISGENEADALIFSFYDAFCGLLSGSAVFSTLEWVFLFTVGLFLIIYSILGFTLTVVKTVKAEASIIMFSILSLILISFCIIDVELLPSYIGMISVLLSLQLSIHQSCIISARNDWWTIIIIFIFAAISLTPIFLENLQFLQKIFI